MDRHSKLIRILLVCLGLLLPLSGVLIAQGLAGSLQFGYAGRNTPMASLGAGQTAFISVGIKLPKMKGNVVKGLSFFLAGSEGEQGNNHSIFIASSADNKVKYIQSVSSFKAGWNEVILSTPFTLSEDAVYYVGYQLQARSTQRPVALEQASSGKLLGVDFLEIGGVYQEVGDPVDFEAIQDEQLGNLLIFAHLEDRVDKLKSVAAIVGASFADAELTGEKEHDLTLKVRNLGSEPITSMDVLAQFGIEPERTLSITGFSIPMGQTQELKTKVVAPRRGLGVFYLSPVKVNGSVNLFADAKAELPYKVKMANASWPRKTMLIERFTTERCVNCPSSEPYFKSLVRQMQDDGMQVSVVAHHAGYYTDAFTVPASKNLVPYSYASGEFAPALMVNRLPDPVRRGFLAGGYEVRLEKYAKARAVNEVLTFTNVRATEKNGSVTLLVEGEVGQIDQENLLLTAVITEDHVRSINQAGASGTFYHDHLARQFLSADYGTPIALKADGTFSLELKGMALNPQWKKENLSVVVFAHKDIRKEDFNNREVYSSKTVSWASATSVEGIAEARTKVYVRDGYLIVDADDVSGLCVFDMAGRLVTRTHTERLEQGVYIVRLGGRSKFTTHKVVVR